MHSRRKRKGRKSSKGREESSAALVLSAPNERIRALQIEQEEYEKLYELRKAEYEEDKVRMQAEEAIRAEREAVKGVMAAHRRPLGLNELIEGAGDGERPTGPRWGCDEREYLREESIVRERQLLELQTQHILEVNRLLKEVQKEHLSLRQKERMMDEWFKIRVATQRESEQQSKMEELAQRLASPVRMPPSPSPPPATVLFAEGPPIRPTSLSRPSPGGFGVPHSLFSRGAGADPVDAEEAEIVRHHALSLSRFERSLFPDHDTESSAPTVTTTTSTTTTPQAPPSPGATPSATSSTPSQTQGTHHRPHGHGHGHTHGRAKGQHHTSFYPSPTSAGRPAASRRSHGAILGPSPLPLEESDPSTWLGRQGGRVSLGNVSKGERLISGGDTVSGGSGSSAMASGGRVRKSLKADLEAEAEPPPSASAKGQAGEGAGFYVTHRAEMELSAACTQDSADAAEEVSSAPPSHASEGGEWVVAEDQGALQARQMEFLARFTKDALGVRASPTPLQPQPQPQPQPQSRPTPGPSASATGPPPDAELVPNSQGSSFTDSGKAQVVEIANWNMLMP